MPSFHLEARWSFWSVTSWSALACFTSPHRPIYSSYWSSPYVLDNHPRRHEQRTASSPHRGSRVPLLRIEDVDVRPWLEPSSGIVEPLVHNSKLSISGDAMGEAGEWPYIKETMNFMHRLRACGRFFVGLWNSSFALLDFMLQRIDLIDDLKEIEQKVHQSSCHFRQVSANFVFIIQELTILDTLFQFRIILFVMALPLKIFRIDLVLFQTNLMGECRDTTLKSRRKSGFLLRGWSLTCAALESTIWASCRHCSYVWIIFSFSISYCLTNTSVLRISLGSDETVRPLLINCVSIFEVFL